jgi:hypothetical protein
MRLGLQIRRHATAYLNGVSSSCASLSVLAHRGCRTGHHDAARRPRRRQCTHIISNSIWHSSQVSRKPFLNFCCSSFSNLTHHFSSASQAWSDLRLQPRQVAGRPPARSFRGRRPIRRAEPRLSSGQQHSESAEIHWQFQVSALLCLHRAQGMWLRCHGVQ